MNLKLRSACGVFVALAATMEFNHSTAEADVYRVDASVAALFTTGPVSTATASFSLLFDTSFLMGTSTGTRKDWPVSQFQTSLNPIGTTTFSPSNVEGFIWIDQGILQEVTVYGVGPPLGDDTGVTENSNDISIELLLNSNGQLSGPGTFAWSVVGKNAVFIGNITNGSSVTVTLVPEPSAILIAIYGFGLLPARCRRPTSHNRR
jgi:hypothetical protein